MNLARNVDLKITKTDKFKDITVHFDFHLPYVEDDYLAYYVLSDLLGEYSDRYPDKLSMTKRKDLLYGAKVEGNAEVFRNTLHFSLVYHFLDPSFITDITFKDDIAFIEETLFHPSFSPKIIEEIKLNYQDRVIRYLDKPGNLLNERTKEELAKDHRLFHDQCGDKRYLLAKTDLIKVQKAYEHLLNDAKISVYVLGNVTEADFMDLKKWGLSTRDDILFDLSPVRLKEHGYVEYQKDISQAYLRIVYNCDTQSDPANYFKRLVANTILGSGPSSRLFKIVREENSLCYSIYSLIKRSEGLAEIVAAASYVHIAKMCSLIDKIITDLGDKGPKEEELMVAKTYLINALNANDDTAKNIIDHLIANDIYQTDLTLHDYIEFIKQVTWDDVKGIVSAYRKKGTFVLRGLDDEKNR